MSRVYIGRLPYRANERDIERFFQGYGKIYEILLKNGYGFVEFADGRDADDACHDLNGRNMMGSSVICEVARGTPRGGDRYRFKESSPPRRNRRDRSRSRERGAERYTRKDDKTEYRLVVQNLSSRVSWQDLKDFFRKVGEVTYADAHGKQKGEGLIEFSNKADMKAALEKLDGKDLEGRKLKLSEERKRKRSLSKSRSKSLSRSRSGSPVAKKIKDEVDSEKKVTSSGSKNGKARRSASNSPSPPLKRKSETKAEENGANESDNEKEENANASESD